MPSPPAGPASDFRQTLLQPICNPLRQLMEDSPGRLMCYEYIGFIAQQPAYVLPEAAYLAFDGVSNRIGTDGDIYLVGFVVGDQDAGNTMRHCP